LLHLARDAGRLRARRLHRAEAGDAPLGRPPHGLSTAPRRRGGQGTVVSPSVEGGGSVVVGCSVDVGCSVVDDEPGGAVVVSLVVDVVVSPSVGRVELLPPPVDVEVPRVGEVVVPPSGERGTMRPVTVSTVVPGGRATMTSLPSSSTMRARSGSGRTMRPSWPNDTGTAGWLGGMSTTSPSGSVGGVTPPTTGTASRSRPSPPRLSQLRPITRTTIEAAISVAPTAGGAVRRVDDPSPGAT